MAEVVGQLKRISGKSDKDPQAKWRVRLSLGRDPLTKRPRGIERKVTGPRKAAEDVLAGLRLDPRATVRAKSSPHTMGQLLDIYLAHLDYLGGEKLTMKGYRGLAGRLQPLIGHLRLDQFGPAELDHLFMRLAGEIDAEGAATRGSNTLRRYNALLTGALKHAHHRGWVAEVVTKGAEMPRVPKHESHPPTVAQVLAVIERVRNIDTIRLIEGERRLKSKDQAGEVMALALHLAVATGVRRGELCGIHWEDLDGNRLKIRRAIIELPMNMRDKDGKGWAEKDTKTHAGRALTLDPGTVALIEDWRDRFFVGLAGDEYMLADLGADPTGRTPIRPEWLTRAWSDNARALGVPGRLHDLRHLHASVLLAEGLPVRDVAGRLGHASTETTLRVYAYVLEGRDHLAADIMERRLAEGAQ